MIRCRFTNAALCAALTQGNQAHLEVQAGLPPGCSIVSASYDPRTEILEVLFNEAIPQAEITDQAINLGVVTCPR